FKTLEDENEGRWSEMHRQLLDYQKDARTAGKNLRTEVELQASDLRAEVEKRLEKYHERLAGLQTTIDEANKSSEVRIKDFESLLGDAVDRTEAVGNKSVAEVRRLDGRLTDYADKTLRQASKVR